MFILFVEDEQEHECPTTHGNFKDFINILLANLPLEWTNTWIYRTFLFLLSSQFALNCKLYVTLCSVECCFLDTKLCLLEIGKLESLVNLTSMSLDWRRKPCYQPGGTKNMDLATVVSSKSCFEASKPDEASLTWKLLAHWLLTCY